MKAVFHKVKADLHKVQRLLHKVKVLLHKVKVRLKKLQFFAYPPHLLQLLTMAVNGNGRRASRGEACRGAAGASMRPRRLR